MDANQTERSHFVALREHIESRHPALVFFPTQPADLDFRAQVAASTLTPIQKAALHLRNDDLESCHALVQDSESPDASYLHGILHRREKDFDNAEYWFRRIGKHPVAAALTKKFPDYDPRSFIALCREMDDSEFPGLARIQAEELRLFLDHVQPDQE